MTFSGIEGLKMISIEKPLLKGVNIDDAFAKVFATTF
jgi:hypothetical protein